MIDARDEEILELWTAREPPDGFADRVLARSRRGGPRDARRRWVWVAAGAAAVALLISLPVGLRPRDSFSERTALQLGANASAVVEPGARLSWSLSPDGEPRVEQRAGDASYRITPPGRLAVSLPDVSLHSNEGAFRVELQPMRKAGLGVAAAILISVIVQEGALQVESARGSTRAHAGERVTVTSDGPPTKAAAIAKAWPAPPQTAAGTHSKAAPSAQPATDGGAGVGGQASSGALRGDSAGSLRSAAVPAQPAALNDGGDQAAPAAGVGLGVLEGTVRDRGRRLPSRAVEVSAVAAASGAVEGVRLQTTADERAAFRFSLPAGDYTLSARYPGQRFARGSTSALVRAGETTAVELVVEDEARQDVTAEVLEPDGSPAAGALVLLVGQFGGQRIAAPQTADGDGKLRLLPWSSIGTDSLELHAQLGGRAGSVTLRSPDTHAAVRLQPAATLDIAVEHAAGETCTVELTPGAGGYLPHRWPARVLGCEQLRLTDVPAVLLRVSVRTSGGRAGSGLVEAAPGGSSRLSIDLRRSASISGRVVDAASGAGFTGWVKLRTGPGQATGADGRFRLEGLTPGEQELSVFGGADHGSASRRFALAEGEAVDLGDLRLGPPAAEAGSIGARFAGERGAVVVSWVLAGSPAALAGLRVGDQILRIDGVPPDGGPDALSRSSGGPGSPVTLLRRRSGVEATLLVVRAN